MSKYDSDLNPAQKRAAEQLAAQIRQQRNDRDDATGERNRLRHRLVEQRRDADKKVIKASRDDRPEQVREIEAGYERAEQATEKAIGALTDIAGRAEKWLTSLERDYEQLTGGRCPL